MSSNNYGFEQYLKENFSAESYFLVIKDVNFQDLEVESAEAQLKWDVDIEARTWGIKEIRPKILSGKVIYEINDEQKEIILPSDFTIGCTIDSKPENKTISLFPKSVEIIAKAKHIEVFF